jgi:hypothetical protein
MATAWTIDWEHRPAEEAALYNPAFCGELLARTVAAYRKASDRAFALPLAFVVLPLTLAPAIRAQLPGKSNTTFATWAAQHEVLLTELPERVLALRPVTREALLFMAQHRALVLSCLGLEPGAKPLKLGAKRSASSTDVEDMQRASGLVGRWLANQINVGAVLLAMGVRP